MAQYQAEAVPDTLYYYCSVSAFLGIVESRQLWMSNGFTMNDFLEVKWADHIIADVLGTYRSDKTNKFLDNVLKHYELNAFQPYFACFSRVGDVLSQWRAYADDGQGFAIGFNTKELGIPKSLPLPNADPAKAVGIHKVIYDEDEQRELVEKHLTQMLDAIERGEEAFENGHWKLGTHYRRLSFVFKNQRFSEEQEWRAIHIPLVPPVSGYDSVKAISRMFFREQKNRIVSYVELNLTGRPNLIREVICGPKNVVDEYHIRMLLEANGFSGVELVRSAASYR